MATGFFQGASRGFDRGTGIGASIYKDALAQMNLEQQQAAQAEQQSRTNQLADSDRVTRDYQFEREMQMKERQMNMKPGGGGAPAGVRLSPDQRYVQATDTVEAIPGSKLYQAEAGRYGKDAASLSSIKQKAGGSVAAIDDFLAKPGAVKSQFGDKYSGVLTRYADPDAAGRLGNIRAGIRSSGLDMMKVGGSIGSMTQTEWPMVEQLMANINNSLSEEEAMFQFEKVKAKLNSIQSEADRLYQLEWANTPYAKPMRTEMPGQTAPAGNMNQQSPGQYKSLWGD